MGAGYKIGAGGEGAVTLAGSLSLADAGHLRRDLVPALEGARTLDVAGVTALDGGAAAVLAAVAAQRGAELVGADGDVARVLALYTERTSRAPLRAPAGHRGLLSHIGDATLELWAAAKDHLAFAGELASSTFGAFRRPGDVRWRDVGHLLERHGADGVPITLVIGFLIGVITAFQSALQLGKFGADSLVADLVSLSMTRELAPLMTAIVVAGRSGAAIAAEIGTMKVSEEVDALRTLGLDPYRFLVLPRILAVLIAAPLLTLLADVVSIAGGLFVAMSSLDVSWQGYVLSVREALGVADVFGGLFKAAVFGGMIALIACER
ncbi:MAG: ABC transporter permease, partial [Planctomycetota bacterium]